MVDAGGHRVGPQRADAARNVAHIREAALTAFRGRGLTTPLADIAAAAGVSKGTVYNHFGGRQGLVDAVIDELVTKELDDAMRAARHEGDPWERLAGWVRARRDLQYREPAFTDAMLMSSPESKPLVDLVLKVREATQDVITRGLEAGVLRPDLTPEDLFWADMANGLALRQLRRPRRDDYDRRTRHFLDSLRPH